MDVATIAKNVKSKEDFIIFLSALTTDLQNNSNEWENIDLVRYFDAMQRFLEDSTEKSLEKIDFTPSWSLFAKVLLVASIYE